MNAKLARAHATAKWLWFLSWLELYLEIYRHHHVSLWRLRSVLFPDTSAISQPGVWVRTVVCTSIAAPVVSLVLIALSWRSPREHGARPSPHRIESAGVWMAVGMLLLITGTVNQLLRHPAFVVDLTLRQGNGGFIILGSTIVVIASTILGMRKFQPRDVDT